MAVDGCHEGTKQDVGWISFETVQKGPYLHAIN